MDLGGFGWIWVDLGGFWVGMMDGGEILGRNASMASQEPRIDGFSQLVVSGCGAISFFSRKINFFWIFGDF